MSQEQKYLELLHKHGICPECGTLNEHHLDGPFASCHCGTSEWYEFTPHMLLQKRCANLETELTSVKSELAKLKQVHDAETKLFRNYRNSIRKHLESQGATTWN